jgi:alpha-L-arabinofuranosidase
MTSYAPLFAHINNWQWTPDLIWMDNLTSFGTANYHVQKLYSTNSGTSTLAIKSNGENLTGQQELYASASLDEKTSEVIIKLVNTSAEVKTLDLNIKGLAKTAFGKSIVLIDKDLKNFNTIDQPNKIVPTESNLSITKGKTVVKMDAFSFVVLRVKK